MFSLVCFLGYFLFVHLSALLVVLFALFVVVLVSELCVLFVDVLLCCLLIRFVISLFAFVLIVRVLGDARCRAPSKSTCASACVARCGPLFSTLYVNPRSPPAAICSWRTEF